MNNFKKNATTILKAATFSLLALATTHANAAVQFRVGFEAATNSYAVYMTPDSTPSRDMLLSAQITLVVPHDAQTQFTVDNIQSGITNVNWMQHSRVDAPAENNLADYISLGYGFSGSTPPAFDWVSGQEKKILSFTSQTGCDARVKLIDNSDAFNQLPNSTNTNPGNDFMNVGWMMSNAYTGNYGSPVTCGGQPVVEACEYNGQDDFYLGRIERLETLRNNAPAYLIARFDMAIENLKSKLSCQK